MEVANPDGMQVFEPDVLLQGGQRSAAYVDEHVCAAGLQQVAGTGIVGPREGRVAQCRPPNGTLWLPPLDHTALLWLADIRTLAAGRLGCEAGVFHMTEG